MADANTVAEVVHWLDETTLYYTYSTIAQTLAGAFGILGAFTLFHLQSINQSLKGVCSTIYHLSPNPSGIIELSFLREDWSSFLDNLNEYGMSALLGPAGIDTEEYELLRSGLNHEINYKKGVIKHLKTTAYLTAIAIVLSLIALAFVPKLVNYAFSSKVLLGLTVGISIGCIFNYMTILVKAISHKTYKVNPRSKTEKKKKPDTN